MLKKRLLIIPLVIFSLLLSCICITASADSVPVYWAITGLDSYYYTESELLSLIRSDYSLPAENFMYIKWVNENSFAPSYNQIIYNSGVLFSNVDSSISVSESNGVYTFTSSGGNLYMLSGSTIEYKGADYDDVGNKGLNRNTHNLSEINLGNICILDTVNNNFYYGSGSANTSVLNGTLWNSLFYYDIDMANVVLNSDRLNVSVEFNPDLSGVVDRSLTDSHGNTAYVQNLFMTVTNNCQYPIQYEMSIYKTNQVTSRGFDLSTRSVSYDDDPVFIYYKNEWIYTTPYDNRGDYWSGDYSRQLKPSHFHYVGAGQSDQVKFDYSQINLQEGVSYTCTVKAIKADYDIASEIHTEVGITEDRLYTELKQVDYLSYETIYTGVFTMSHYSDVHYDETNSENGVLPFNGYDYTKRYTMSRLAVDNGDGTVDYTNKNFYDDNSSWYNNQDSYRYSDLLDNGSGSSNYSNSSYSSLLRNTSSVFTFFSSVLGFFPTDILIVYNLGLWSIVVLLIIRRLH